MNSVSPYLRSILIAAGLIATSFSSQADDHAVPLSTLDWEPYIGKTLDGKGYVHEVVAAAFARSGYTLDAKFYPWARAVKTAREGEVAGLFPEYYDASRLEEFVFSDPYPGGPVGFYKRKDAGIAFSSDPQTQQDAALRALSQYKFGTVRGYINTATFDAADYLTKQPATSDEINLRKLFFKRVDLIFIDRLVAEHLLNTRLPKFKGALEFMLPALENKDLYIAFSKAHPQHENLRNAFNAGLREIGEDGTLADILERRGFLSAISGSSAP